LESRFGKDLESGYELLLGGGLRVLPVRDLETDYGYATPARGRRDHGRARGRAALFGWLCAGALAAGPRADRAEAGVPIYGPLARRQWARVRGAPCVLKDSNSSESESEPDELGIGPFVWFCVLHICHGGMWWCMVQDHLHHVRRVSAGRPRNGRARSTRHRACPWRALVLHSSSSSAGSIMIGTGVQGEGARRRTYSHALVCAGTRDMLGDGKGVTSVVPLLAHRGGTKGGEGRPWWPMPALSFK